MSKQFDDDFAPVVGGSDATRYRSQDCVAPKIPDDACDLDLHLSRLLALHPDIPVKFRNQSLSNLDTLTKLAILDGINHLLGIQPLKVP